MTALLWLMLIGWSRIELVNQDFQIPAADRWAVGDPIHQAAWIECAFFAEAPDARVRVVLLSRADWRAWLAGREHDEIDATPIGRHGALRVAVHEPDTVVVIDNRGAQPATVHLRVVLDQPRVGYLSRGRQIEVILISFGVFFGIVSLSARKLLRAIGK